MCMLMLAEETNFLLMEGKQHSGTSRATSGPVLNLLMPCLCKYCHFPHCWELPLMAIEIYWRWGEEETLFR